MTTHSHVHPGSRSCAHPASLSALLQGRRLLALTQSDLYQLVDTKLDADLLSDAIHDLRLRAVIHYAKDSMQRHLHGMTPCSLHVPLCAGPPLRCRCYCRCAPSGSGRCTAPALLEGLAAASG